MSHSLARARQILISIGTEPAQWLPTKVLESSIRRRTQRPVTFVNSWDPQGGWHPLMTSHPKLAPGTKFSGWRWLVPSLAPASRVIYLDADQCVLADIADLIDSLEAGVAFAAVRNAVGIFGNKVPEPNHWQTSVMAMNTALCNWDARALFESVARGTLPYRDLMQAKFKWENMVLQELDPGWNHFGIRDDNTKLIHWSHVKTQPWRNPKHSTANIWIDEVKASLAVGHVTRHMIEQALRTEDLHHSFAERLL